MNLGSDRTLKLTRSLLLKRTPVALLLLFDVLVERRRSCDVTQEREEKNKNRTGANAEKTGGRRGVIYFLEDDRPVGCGKHACWPTISYPPN